MNKKEIIKQGVDLFNKHFPKDKQNKLVEVMKKDPDLKKHYKDIEALNETQMKQLIKVCTLLNLDQIKILKSKVKTYEQDINKRHKEDLEAISLIQQSINNTKQ